MVFVHPAVPVERPALVYPPFLFEFTFDTTRAFVNLPGSLIDTTEVSIPQLRMNSPWSSDDQLGHGCPRDRVSRIGVDIPKVVL